jgi:hypothetical protein
MNFTLSPELTILFISTGLLVLGAYFWQKGNHLLKNGKKAEAIVFSNTFKANSDNGVYYPVVRFLTDKQEWITKELNIGTNPKKPEGTKIQVLYDPEDPTDVQINSTFALEILPRIFTTLGVMGAAFVVLEVLDVINTLP